MPITKILFSKSVEAANNIGLKSWKKFGAEYELPESEQSQKGIEDAVEYLKNFVNDNLKQQMIPTPEPSVQVEKVTAKTISERMIESINAQTDVEVLKKTFGKYANSSDEKIKTAYQEKLQSFSK